MVNRMFDLRPYSIIKKFGLQRPIFKQTAHGGHFGREEFPWEQVVDLSEEKMKMKGMKMKGM